MKAIVLVKFTSLETKAAYQRLRSLIPVTESHLIYGRFDAMAFIEAENLDHVRKIVLSEIQSIPGVIETMPCLIVEDESFITNEQDRSTKTGSVFG